MLTKAGSVALALMAMLGCSTPRQLEKKLVELPLERLHRDDGYRYLEIGMEFNEAVGLAARCFEQAAYSAFTASDGVVVVVFDPQEGMWDGCIALHFNHLGRLEWWRRLISVATEGEAP